MNNRDPFNLRRSPGPAFNLLQSSATNLVQKIAESGQSAVREVAREAQAATANMSSYAPQYQDGPVHRNPDVWQSSGQSRHSTGAYTNSNGSSAKVSGYFGADRKDSLPMYKDKPYAYPGSKRKQPWYRQKRRVALILTALAGISWWFGILSPLYHVTKDRGKTQGRSNSGSSWFRSESSEADWQMRAEKVKETFKISFDGYEKYAWGMCRVWLSQSNAK